MNKIINIFLFLLIFVCNNYFAQAVIRFQKAIGNSGYDIGYSVIQTLDTGFVVGGSTTSFGNGNNDMYLVKTNKFGVPQRDATFGGINVDKGMCVKQTSDSGYILCGYTNSFGSGGYDVYVVKTDSTLQEQWSRTYGGSDWDFGNCIEQTDEGGYIICGSTYSYGSGDMDYYILKLNDVGDTLWTKTYGDTLEDIANSIIQTSEGNYVVTGTTKSLGDTLGDFWTLKLNSVGDTLWTNKFGGTEADAAKGIIEKISGGYMVAGGTKSYGAGDSDAIALKISVDGISDTIYTIGLAGFETFESITQRSDGKIGMVGSALDLGFGPPGDVFYTALNQDLSFYNANTYGDALYDVGFCIASTYDNAFIVCGATKNCSQNGLDDLFLVKTDSFGNTFSLIDCFLTNTETFNSSNSETLTIYPNPANQEIHLVLESKVEGECNVIISDIIGREIFTKKINLVNQINKNLDFKTSDLYNGLYFITIQNKNYNKTLPFIINHL